MRTRDSHCQVAGPGGELNPRALQRDPAPSLTLRLRRVGLDGLSPEDVGHSAVTYFPLLVDEPPELAGL